MLETVTESKIWKLSTDSVHRIFERRVAERPHAVAIHTLDRPWSYGELNACANRVANRLRRFGVAPGDLVAVSALRSPETIAALLGVLKLGAAYIPLDSSYPDERLRFMLADTGTRCLLADEVCAKRLAGSVPEGCSLLLLNSAAEENSEAVSHPGTPSDLLSIIYTSGSTGTPKGVMIEHRGVTRLVIEPDYVAIRQPDVFSHLAPFSFDTSLFEIFGALLNGASLLVLPSSVTNLPEIAEAIARFKVTTMWLTSGLFSAMIDECPQFARQLRYLVVGGDVVSVPHARKAFSQMQDGALIDGYGPTENTTFSTAHRIVPEDLTRSAIPIGRPIQGSGAWILNDKLKPVAQAEEGELYVTGDGLARGYWNRPELTAERFFDIEPVPGQRVRAYRTGDLARYQPDGTIDFLGRIDTQVKIRGFRIELTELETRMADCDQVAVAVAVAATASQAADRHLRLCYVLKKGALLSPAQAEQFLRERLPDYMVPSEYVQLPRIPLDPNGKFDRKALARMESKTLQPAAAPVRDLTPVETELLAMMRDLLKNPAVAIDDDFFLIGGHSLLAARLFAQIEARFGRRLPLALMLQARTMRNLAAAVDQPDHSPVWSSLVPLRKEGSGTPVFLLHAIGGNVIGYRELALLLPEDLPVYGIQAQGLDGVTQMPDTLPDMAAIYVEQIRSVQAQGPYFLCGFSAGGVMAFEIARQLENAGQHVGLIGLIDSNLTSSPAVVLRQQGVWAALAQISNVIRWNFWYATQIGVATFLSRKFRNFRLNLRLAWFALLRTLNPGAKSNEAVRLSVEEAFVRAMRLYDPGNISAKAILFRTEDSALYDPNQEAAWRRSVAGGLQVCTVTGTHETMLESPNLENLVAEFVSAMQEAKADASTGSSLALRSAERASDRLRIVTMARGA